MNNTENLCKELIKKNMDAIKSFNWNYKGSIPNSFNELIKENIVVTWNNYHNEKIIKLKSKKQAKKINK